MKTRRARAAASTKRSRIPAQVGSPAARRAADPELEREAARYAEPVPSRELILRTLNEEGVPVEEKQLARLLGVRRHETESFSRRLAAMEREGQILRNRKGAILVAGKVAVVRGRVEAHPDGFGFVAPDDGTADLYLAPGEMRGVMHGDTRARAAGGRRSPRPARGADRRGRRARASQRGGAASRRTRCRVRGRRRPEDPA